MQLLQNLSVLALRQVLSGAMSSVAGQFGADAALAVVDFLQERFTDQSERLTGALTQANERAWNSLEIALAGDSLWERCKLLVTSTEDKAFRQQVRAFLDATPLEGLPSDQFRRECLTQLRAAKRSKALSSGNLDPQALAHEVGSLARHGDPLKLLDAETRLLEGVAEQLAGQGYKSLAQLVVLKPESGTPLLVMSVRYFFRRAVEDDEKLFHGLAFAQMERLQQTQEDGFEALRRLLDEQGGRVEGMLDDVLAVVTETHTAVLDIQEEQRRQGEQNQDIYRAVIDVQRKLDLLQHDVRPRDSLSIRTDGERRLVREVVERYRALPEGERKGLPALLNAIGKLEVAAGEFQTAERDFVQVAELVTDRQASGEAHMNAHRAALERRDWDAALREMLAAVKLDEGRFAPFPISKYEPLRILGAGGFGVAYLCRHRQLGAEVVVKTLTNEGLDRDVDEVFTEAKALWVLDHPAIIRLHDCGYADGVTSSRPYFVMSYFDGLTLEDQARKQPLTVDELLQVARQMAEGLHAAHAHGILHRDVKPGNVLVRKAGETWQAKLIDFGLALRRDSLRSTATRGKTLVGSSIAGTLDYASPEQMGRLEGVAPGPMSDVYGFGKTCCFALFQTPTPLARHWRSLPTHLADLLENCLEEDPEKRPASMQAVLARLTPTAAPSGQVPFDVVTPPGPASGAPSKEKPDFNPTELELVSSGPLEPLPDPASLTIEQRRTELAKLAEKVRGCTRCPALVKSRTQTVFGTGPLDPVVCFIGQAPAAEEDGAGEPLVGPAGQLLNKILTAMGLTREEVYLADVVKCRPPANRTPLPNEAKNCREYLERQIALVRPKVICALGSPAAQNLLGTSNSLGKMRGRFHDYKGIPVLVTYHPAFLLPHRSPEKKKEVWEDMKLLLQKLGRPVPG